MSADPARIRQELAALRQQIAQSEEIAPGLRASLAETLSALEAQIGETSKKGGASLKDRLSEAVLEFEESHPKFARALEGVMETLATIGI